MSEIKSGYTRISEILARLKDLTKINKLVLHEKANIGTEVHSNIHSELVGCPTMFDEFPIRHHMTGQILFDKQGNERWEKRGVGYFRSWTEWQNKVNPQYLIMEDRYYDDELMITGQVDAVAVIDGQVSLLDYKCSYSPDLIVWPMQAHFYWYLLHKNGIEISNKFVFLQLKKDGSYPTVHEFIFDKNILSRCIEETIKHFEEKSVAQMLD